MLTCGPHRKYLAMDDALNITEQIYHRFESSNHLMFFPLLGVIMSAFRSHRCHKAYSVSLQINYCELWELELQNAQITQKSCRHLLAIRPSGLQTTRKKTFAIWYTRQPAVASPRHECRERSQGGVRDWTSGTRDSFQRGWNICGAFRCA